ncbi:hypothetical protein NPIL_306371 [Nephila pilipes]|uniref:Uncharacterized protein n=1 Tax=Nephila pilipes TaxID=299642 RepID=A0A8X6R666_NEPPI|nr:hypothetical protein NPIL_306371 [Nephila pilipes]
MHKRLPYFETEICNCPELNSWKLMLMLGGTAVPDHLYHNVPVTDSNMWSDPQNTTCSSLLLLSLPSRTNRALHASLQEEQSPRVWKPTS